MSIATCRHAGPQCHSNQSAYFPFSATRKYHLLDLSFPTSAVVYIAVSPTLRFFPPIDLATSIIGSPRFAMEGGRRRNSFEFNAVNYISRRSEKSIFAPPSLFEVSPQTLLWKRFQYSSD